MGNPAVLPMIGPDGTAALIPRENIQAAANFGARPALKMYGPDGSPAYIPMDRMADAVKAGAMTEGQYQQKINPAPPDGQPHGFIQSLVAPIPQMAQGLYRNFTTPAQNSQEQSVNGSTPQSGLAARALGQFGLGAYRTLVAPSIEAGKNAKQSLQEGHPLEAVSNAIEGVPLLGGGVTAGKQAILQHYEGDNAGAAGTVIGNLLSAGLADALIKGKMGANINRAVPSGLTEPLDAPQINPALSPVDRSAVAITKAVNPAPAAWPQYLEAIKNQVGNVLDYAKRNGLNITDARDLAAVAAKAKEETQAHYNNNILGPNATATAPVSVGDLAGTSPTLSAIDQRIVDIAREQQSQIRKPTPGQAFGATDAQLSDEKAHLADILHRSLGDLTGMDPRDVQETRQRMAQLGVIAGETQGGANAVSRSAGIQEVGGGSSLPTSKAGILDRFVQMIPGQDAESVAAKKLLAALKATPIEGTQLNPTYPGSGAPMSAVPSVNRYFQDIAAKAAVNNDLAPTQADIQAAKQGPLIRAMRRAADQKTISNVPKLFGSTTNPLQYLKAPDINQ